MPKGLDLEAKVEMKAARAVGSQFWTREERKVWAVWGAGHPHLEFRRALVIGEPQESPCMHSRT